MIILTECTYCGDKQRYDYEKIKLIPSRCKICNDSKLIQRKETDVVIDYYQGCPPFPPNKPKEDKPLNDYDDDEMFNHYYY